MITGENPNLLLEDVQFKSFARSAVLIMNAAGKPDRPIQLQRLWTITQGDEKPRGAIYFDANPKALSAGHQRFHRDRRLRISVGIDQANAIQFRDDRKVLVPTHPGR